MAYTFAQLKVEVRAVVFPAGESLNLVVAHNKFILDALIDLQTWVECLQVDNTTLVPQCATIFNCGLTVLDAPRGAIKSVSVIDKINPETEEEDPEAADDWCTEIFYKEVDFCHVNKFLATGRSFGCCPSIPLFFSLNCCKGSFPAPTDEGLTGLPLLPLGYHYGQESTDDEHGRALAGVWAKERGKIFIAPWLQSTETVVVKWDGIKRTFADADLVDDDPLLKKAVEEYLRKEHAGKFDKDMEEFARATAAYNETRAMLIHQCREETRIRDCEPSHARASSPVQLFYNDQQQATSNCPDGTTGSARTYTVNAGTVASTISVADANQKALDEAKAQAEALLNCVDVVETFYNDEQSFTAQCTVSGDPPLGTPMPQGNPVTVTVAAGTVSSTVSKAAANTSALAQAQADAESQLECTFWNTAQEYVAQCPNSPYFDYFQALNGERYYNVVRGPVEFFFLDSDTHEDALDGTSSGSVQGQWLQSGLAASTASWKVVIAHHAPYSSDSTHGNSSWMQWPFAAWGADIVLSGHAHDYERLSVAGFPYIVTGWSGKDLRLFGAPLAESVVRYNTLFGAVRIKTEAAYITFEAINTSGVVVDTFTLGVVPGSPNPTIMAAIGDFGGDTADEAVVAALVASWGPTTVVTVGDNKYPVVPIKTLDEQVGKHYQAFISPYSGAFGAGAVTNMFFPALGNHDWALFVVKRVAAHVHSSTISQADADALALNAAKVDAEDELLCESEPVVFYSTQQQGSHILSCLRAFGLSSCQITVNITVVAGHSTSVISQSDANIQAFNYARQQAQLRAQQICSTTNQCGTFDATIP